MSTYFTPSVERLLGYTPDEALALELESLLTPDSLERVRATLADGIQGAERGDVIGLRVTEVDQCHKDGSIVPVEVTTRFLPAPDGRPHLVLGVSRDITERRRAEEALRERRQQHETIIRTTLDGLLLTDVSGRVLEANEAYCALSGYSEEELLTMSIQDLEAMSAEEVAARMGRVAAGVPDRFESRHRRKDGSFFDAEVSIRFEPSDGGWFAGFVRDITTRKEAEHQLAVINAELEQRVESRTAQLEAANKELETFAYSVSHDLRAPLRAIDGFSALVVEDGEGKLDAEDLDHLRRVREAAQRMATLIDDLLGLSRVGRQDMKLATVDVSTVAEDVFAELREAEPGRTVECVVAPGMRAEADPVLLRVILANLIGNSWKFTSRHETARIEVGEADTEGEHAFFVRDDGAGCDMRHAGNLFGAFQRVHLPEEFDGTGIGLATVQRLVARHSGRVWADAEVEKGATFFFTLTERSLSSG